MNPIANHETEVADQPRPSAASPGVERNYGLLSRLRSYCVLVPLVWLYTILLGIISIPVGWFDRDGRRLHGFARFWSRLIMKTILSPVNVTGFHSLPSSHNSRHRAGTRQAPRPVSSNQ